MVVSVNSTPSKEVFQSLLDDTVKYLKAEATKSPKTYLSYLGNKLEGVVADVMTQTAKGTPFEDSIELISGQRFPDIIAKKYYGVEVKTSKQNHWTATGNSVLESTRVDDIERIYMLFGKMVSPVDFMCRPYEECLSEIVVTHSPRYQIDMELPEGQTIFDKLNIPYDQLRSLPNPIKPITDYYRQFLKAGEQVWWLEQDEAKATGLIIKSWNNIAITERNKLIASSMVYFPEVFSNSQHKFNGVGTWLINDHGIICPNTRDAYTAGGKGQIEWKKRVYTGIPKVLIKMINLIDLIRNAIDCANKEVLTRYWCIKVTNRWENWIDLVVQNTRYMRLDFDLKAFLHDKMQG